MLRPGGKLARSTGGHALLLTALFLQCETSRLVAQSIRDSRPLVPTACVPLKGVEGRLDHLAVDVASRKLFVAALEDHSVEVIDLAKRRRIHRLTGINEPQGLLFLPEHNRLLVCCRGDGTCRTFDARTYQEGPWADLGRNADNIRFDPASKLVLVGSGGEPGAGAFTAVPLAPLLPVTQGGQPSPPHSPADFLLDRPRQADSSMELPLPSHPESFQLDRANHRIFVNMPDEHQIAVLTLSSNLLSLTGTWPVTAGEKNFPMAFDAVSSRVFIATRKPPCLIEYDAPTGRVLSQTPCVGDADDLFCDAKVRRIYVIGGEGFVDVFQRPENAGEPVRLARVPTAFRARTGLHIPELSLFAIAVPHTTNGPATLLLFRTNP